jgi:hypothetical protein
LPEKDEPANTSGRRALLDPLKRRALSDFYREEFLRYLDHFEAAGIVDETGRALIARARQTVLCDLDRVCWREQFPALAEKLLQNFDTLSRLSQVDPRARH